MSVELEARTVPEHKSSFRLLISRKKRVGPSGSCCSAYEDRRPPVPYLSLFRYANTKEKVIMGVGIFFAVAMGFTLPGILVLCGGITKKFVDQAHNITNASRSVQEQFLQDGLYFGLYSCLISSLQVLLDYIIVVCFYYTAEHQILRIRNEFFKSMLRQDISWYDTHANASFCSKITENIQKLQEGIGEKAPICLSYVATFVVCIVISLYQGWELTLVILSVVPGLIAANVIASMILATMVRDELKSYSAAGDVASEVLMGLKTVVAFGGQEKEVERYKENLSLAHKMGTKRAMASGVGNGIFWFLNYVLYAVSFWYGIRLILRSRKEQDDLYDVEKFTVVFLCILIGAIYLGQGSPFFETFAAARGATGAVFDVMERKPIIDCFSEMGLRPFNFHGVIEFCDVDFFYPARTEVQILRKFNLTVKPGEVVALVGSSGSGKSTILHLVQRFYDPTGGVVKLDGVDLRQLNVQWLRSHFGVVGQEPALFGMSISDNIRLGKLSASQYDIEEAAIMANAHDFIMKLPQMYDTILGEGGARLSGGQKQRVAIARALVRDPKILLLDEATSALDFRNEAVVQRALDEAKRGRTTLVVSHRLSAIRSADRILVLDSGQVVEEGTHDNLMRKGAIYHNMVKSQCHTEEDVIKRSKSPKGSKSRARTESPVSSSDSGASMVGKSRTSLVTPKMSDDVEPAPLSVSKVLKISLPEWPYLLVGTLGSAIQGATWPAYSYFFGEVTASMSTPNDDDLRYWGDYYSMWFMIIGVISGVAAFFQYAMFTISGDKLTMRLRKLTFKAMMDQESAWHDRSRNSSGALSSRLSSDAASVQGAAGNRLGILVQAGFTMSLSIIMSVFLSWKLGTVVALTVPFVMFSAVWENDMIVKQNLSEKEALEKGSNLALEAVSNFRTVASLGCQEAFLDMYHGFLRTPHKQSIKNSHLRGFIYGMAQGLPNAIYGLSISFGAYLVINDGLKFATVFTVSEALVIGAITVGQAFSMAPSYTKGRLAAGLIMQLVERTPEVRDSTDYILYNVPGKGDSLSMHDVRFFYATRPSTQTLSGIDLHVDSGQTVALVGPSGCGKSTILQLILRLYDPTWGKVSMSGVDLRDLRLKYVRGQLGLVSQEPVLFNRTIGENIAYGDNSREVPIEEIIEAAKVANIHNFIADLPRGYDTMVGSKGTQLSGGQKQRVAIARAVVRNPAILLLDEATSALDTTSEKLVQAALEKAQEGRTCIVIAHRLSTICGSDLIVVIDHGVIVEAGTHNELLDLGGLYYRLYHSAEDKVPSTS